VVQTREERALTVLLLKEYVRTAAHPPRGPAADVAFLPEAAEGIALGRAGRRDEDIHTVRYRGSIINHDLDLARTMYLSMLHPHSDFRCSSATT
jgi:hypothetical protein